MYNEAADHYGEHILSRAITEYILSLSSRNKSQFNETSCE